MRNQERYALGGIVLCLLVMAALFMTGPGVRPVWAAAGTITPQDISTTAAITVTASSEAGDGLEFANNGRCLLVIGAEAVTRTQYITVVTAATYYGYAIADLEITNWSQGTRVVGPFTKELFNDSSGNVHVDVDPYDFGGDLTLSVIRY